MPTIVWFRDSSGLAVLCNPTRITPAIKAVRLACSTPGLSLRGDFFASRSKRKSIPTTERR